MCITLKSDDQMNQNLKTTYNTYKHKIFPIWERRKIRQGWHILLDFNPSKPLAIKNKHAHNNTHIKIQLKKGRILC